MNLFVSWYYNICILKQSALQNFTLVLLVIWHMNFVSSLITISQRYYDSMEVSFVLCFYGSLLISTKIAFKGIIIFKQAIQKIKLTQKRLEYVSQTNAFKGASMKLSGQVISYFKVIPLQQNNEWVFKILSNIWWSIFTKIVNGF